MYALPGQSPAQSRRDIELAINANPAHISFYQLTLNRIQHLRHSHPVLPEDDLAWDMQQPVWRCWRQQALQAI